MADLLSIYPVTVWIVLLTTGVVIGLLAGLLGVGGGIVAVPILLEVFAVTGVPADAVVPPAVGTAHTSILIASVTAASAHWRAGTIDRPLIKEWRPAILVGTALGLALGPFAPARLLVVVFAALAAGLGIKMALGDQVVLGRHPPKGAVAQLPPVLVGAFASALGVGGGTLSTPVLSLFSFPIRRAIGAGALFNLIISLPATIAFLAMGWGTTGRPAGSVGDVAMFCVAALSLPALFVAPMAARWSSRAPAVLLRRSFAFCLCAIAIRIVSRT